MFHKVIGCRSVYSHMNKPYVPEFCSFPQWGSHHYTRCWCRAAQSGHWDGEYGALRPLKAAPRTAAGSTFSRPSLEVSWSTDYIEPLETPLITGYFSYHFPGKVSFSIFQPNSSAPATAVYCVCRCASAWQRPPCPARQRRPPLLKWVVAGLTDLGEISGIDESQKSKFESRNFKFWSRISRVEREILSSDLEFRE